MTAAVKLYELADARDILDSFLLETGGEVTPEIEALLEQLDGEIDDKVERVALYIREQLTTAKAIKEEEQRLADRRAAMEKAAEGLKRYLQRQLERLGKSKIDGLLCTVALQKNSQPTLQVCVTPEALYVTQGSVGFVRQEKRVDYVLDRTAVIDAWKRGEALPNGLAVTLGYHIRIR